MPRESWIDKKFEFAFPVDEYESFLETLASTPDRLESFLHGLSTERLTRRPESGWSIQENAGHLINVEALFMGRLDDYDAGLEELRPADMTNRATEAETHNDSDIDAILGRFREVRTAYLDRLAGKPASYFGTVAWHPRLEKPMRVVDQLHFQVEHDAHHLARIGELL